MEVETMMVRITADKKEAATTQKAVAQQEQEANEQAAQVCHQFMLHTARHKPAWRQEENAERVLRHGMYACRQNVNDS